MEEERDGKMAVVRVCVCESISSDGSWSTSAGLFKKCDGGATILVYFVPSMGGV